MSKNLLLIDGSYIGHRSLYSLGKQTGLEVTLDTNEEMRLFEMQLYNDIISLYKSFSANVTINNVLFFVDKNSWRNNETMIKPYYETDEKLIGYKENRKSTKDKSVVDWGAYHDCLENVTKKINKLSGFLGLCENGFEADDLIAMTSFIYSNLHTIFIFANDGDYEQTVINKNIYYIRNTKSKDNPDGYLIVDKFYVLPFKKNFSGIELLQKKMQTTSGFVNKISRIDIGNHYPGEKVRTNDNGKLLGANPFYFGFVKSVIGDKKDNILPIIGRYTESGRLTRVLEKNINSAFDSIRSSFDFDLPPNITNNELAKLIVKDIRTNDTPKTIQPYTKFFIINLIMQMNHGSIAKNVYNHLKLNIKIMMLTELLHNIPVASNYKNNITPLINEKLEEKISLDIDIYNLNKPKDILHNSIPDEEVIGSKENDSEDGVLRILRKPTEAEKQQINNKKWQTN